MTFEEVIEKNKDGSVHNEETGFDIYIYEGDNPQTKAQWEEELEKAIAFLGLVPEHKEVIKKFIYSLLQSQNEELVKKLPLEKIHQLPDDVGSHHETEHDRGWNDYRKEVLTIIQSQNYE